MRKTSVLKIMGVQVWRLRGSQNSSYEFDVQNHSNLGAQSETIESAPAEPRLDDEYLGSPNSSLAEKVPDVHTERPQRSQQEPRQEPQTAEDLGDTLEIESVTPSFAESSELKTDQTLSSDIKVLQPVQATEVSSERGLDMPKLRPAPVPLRPESEAELFPSNSNDEESIQPKSSSEGRSENEHIEPSVLAAEETVEPAYSDDVKINVMQTGVQQNNSESKALNNAPIPDSDWRSLQAKISSSEHCPSCSPTRSTLGFGDVLADWMFIADAPTSAELEVQQLFTGRASQLYDAILIACGLRRSDVYSTTIFKCAAPEDISIRPQCDRLIHTQITLVKPKIIVAFGEFAAQAVLQSNEPMEVLLRGKHYYAGGVALVIPSYSPQELLADPRLKATLWKELKMALSDHI